MVGTPTAEKWCGSQLSNTMAPRSVQPLKKLPIADLQILGYIFFVFRILRYQEIKNQAQVFMTKIQVQVLKEAKSPPIASQFKRG